MLVLSRHRDEAIMIGDDVELTIVDIRGDKVRIGVRAPSAVAVHRKEVYEAILRENVQAARLVADPIVPAIANGTTSGASRLADRIPADGGIEAVVEVVRRPA